MQLFLLKFCAFMFGPGDLASLLRLHRAEAVQSLVAAEVALCRAEARRGMYADLVERLKTLENQLVSVESATSVSRFEPVGAGSTGSAG